MTSKYRHSYKTHTHCVQGMWQIVVISRLCKSIMTPQKLFTWTQTRKAKNLPSVLLTVTQVYSSANILSSVFWTQCCAWRLHLNVDIEDIPLKFPSPLLLLLCVLFIIRTANVIITYVTMQPFITASCCLYLSIIAFLTHETK